MVAAAKSSQPTACKSPSCKLCGDTGWYDLGNNTVCECSCQAIKKERERLADSGLLDAMDTLTFSSFVAETPWQQRAMDIASGYASHLLSGGKGWLYAGGAVGSGKTHLCTAICGKLLKAGIRVRYMLWPEESQRIKADINDAEALDRLLNPLMKVPVLYIDDLFKCQHEPGGRPEVTKADVKISFQILDARYRQKLPTLLSSEWMIQELMDIDEGTFSRVYQMCKSHMLLISREPGRNYRFK